MSLSKLIFGDITLNREDLELKYPPRKLKEGAMVTRLGPSPTGFIHLGNLYGAFIDERLATQSEGLMYLRIEDTDDKRYVEGAVDTIIDSLAYFDINFDEGATSDGEKGSYGSYYQSLRGDIYKVYVKELLDRGQAYPCFLKEEEIEEIRKIQMDKKDNPGIYGEYAKYRDISFDEAKKKIENGEEFVVRLKSDGKDGEDAKYINIEDGIRGKISMPENFQDTVILKKNGIPTYHFAHVIDDHLMRTTHVVRGEEWLSSLPIHIELFEKLGFDLPIYCHTAQLMKIEDGNKRKLSKRKDPELSLDFYKELGYHKDAIKEYLLTILNSNFEEWRKENPDLSWQEFHLSLDKMSTSGALFDMNKLDDISKDVLVRKSADELYEFLVHWAKTFKEEGYKLLKENEKLVKSALDIGREGQKPRKDLICASQIFDFIKYFFDEYFEVEEGLPIEVSEDDARTILKKYLDVYNQEDDNSVWFEKIREISQKLGYALKPKDFKKNPDMYKGHVGHVSTVVRLAVVGRSQSPDLWEIQQLLGRDRVLARVEQYLKSI